MAEKLQALIETAKELSVAEQLELISAVSQLVRGAYRDSGSTFWHSKTVEQLIAEQRVRPVESLKDLTVDFWPEKESADELIEYIYQQRLEDRLAD
jgi:hypothetical protein